MKIAIILGTRPEIIKMAPIIREIEKRWEEYFIIHTNQHYSKEMDEIIFTDLKINKAKYNLEVGSWNHWEQTWKMLWRIEKVFFQEKPDVVLVHGDTNTTLAWALAAKKMQIKVWHIEAWLRSFDNTMPEETNRILVDHLSDYLFAPTKEAAKNAKNEWMSTNKINIVWNTVVDAILQHKKLAKNSKILNKLHLEKNNYWLLTCHRPANTDNKENLENIISALSEIWELYKLTIIFTAHPRTENKIKEFEIEVPKNIKIIQPIWYLDMIKMMSNSKLIFTDSGWIQEEACILNIPTVTLRDNTERPESMETWWNILAWANKEKIIFWADEMINWKFDWTIKPFWKWDTAYQILDILIKNK